MILPDEYAWEQLPDESAKAFQAFQLYLNMGIERSISKVHEKCSKSTRLIARWSSEWEWGERIRRYDTWKQQIKRAKLREKIEASAEEDYKTVTTLQSILVAPAAVLQEKMKIHIADNGSMTGFFQGSTNDALLEATVAVSRVIPNLQSAKREALGVLERMDEEKTEVEESESIQPPSITIIPRAADRDKTERPADVGDV